MGEGFSDYGNAARLRDAVKRIVVRVLDNERPRYRYGIVQTIDRVASTCTVAFDNDTDNPVTVRMGSIQPNATGQIVRVAGLTGDRFVDDVMGTAYTDTSTTVGDATAVNKGVLRLTGDLGGTAAAPTVPGLAGKAPTVHSHAEGDVTNLVADLGNKTDVGHQHAEADVVSLVADLGTKQPLDADLTAIAGLNSAAAGMIASDGAGWIAKTYAQVKTALALVKADVGLGNVDNTSDANKPISTATQTALNAKQPLDADLTAIAGFDSAVAGAIASDGAGWVKKTYAQFKTALTLVKADVGLGNVDNTSDAAKPVSTAQQAALDGKQNLDADLTTIAAINSATAGMIASDGGGWIQKTYAQVKTALALAKADVGLGNVDNTSDANKPISTATQTALNSKADLVGGVIPSAQIPAIATGQTVTVASQATMLALTSAQVQPGDIAIRTDQSGQRWLLAAANPAVLANWIALEVPDSVISVNGQTGTVNLTAANVGAQPADADLTALAGLDANTAGVAATDGAGWIKKTYVQLKTSLALVKGDVGLGNVDNTSDANKPVSTAQAAADATRQPLDADLTAIAALDSATAGAIASDGAGWVKKTYAQFKTALGLVKADVGLGNVDNTADSAKPVSTAQQAALDTKQPLDADLTTIAAMNAATAGMIASDGASWIQKTYAQVKTALGLVKGDVGLGNVDNTSDANKPVSTATQTALNGKVDKSTYGAKGSILVATAAGSPVDLPIGANDTVPIADSTQPTGIRWGAVAGGGATGMIRKTQRFNSSGTFTPNSALLAGLAQVDVEIVSGGGAGGGAIASNGRGGGGGGSGWALRFREVPVSGAVSVVVGAGGTGAAGAAGGSGGESSFGGLFAPGGGGGGTSGTSFAGGSDTRGWSTGGIGGSTSLAGGGGGGSGGGGSNSNVNATSHGGDGGLQGGGGGVGESATGTTSGGAGGGGSGGTGGATASNPGLRGTLVSFDAEIVQPGGGGGAGAGNQTGGGGGAGGRYSNGLGGVYNTGSPVGGSAAANSGGGGGGSSGNNAGGSGGSGYVQVSWWE